MTQRNPIGQHLQRVKSVDDNWFVDQCQKAAYSTVTVLDAAALAGRVQSEGGVPYTVFRDSKFEPVPPATDDATIKEYARNIYEQIRLKVQQCGNPSVHIMVNCEQGHAPHRIKMYTELMNLAVSDLRGMVGMVFLNASIGSIPIGFYGENNDFTRPDMLTFLKTLDAARTIRLPSGAYAFLLGVHNYSSQYPWIATNGGEHRTPSWEVANAIRVNWQKPQDHIGREYQGIRKALGWVWNNNTGEWYTSSNTVRRGDGKPVDPPWMVATEALIDDVDGVPIQATHLDMGAQKPRGFNSLKTQWEQYWFKPDPHGVTLAKMSAWAWRTIMQQDGYCIGLHNFSLGDTGGWETFNTALNGNPNMDYFNAVKAIRFDMPDHFFKRVDVPTPPIVVTPPPQPEEPPEPVPPALDVVFCQAQIAALELQIAAWKRLKQKLENAATSNAA